MQEEWNMKVFINSSNVDSMVGAAGFEPTISCSQSRRATKLRYTPRRNERVAAGEPEATQPVLQSG